MGYSLNIELGFLGFPGFSGFRNPGKPEKPDIQLHCLITHIVTLNIA